MKPLDRSRTKRCPFCESVAHPFVGEDCGPCGCGAHLYFGDTPEDPEHIVGLVRLWPPKPLSEGLIR